MSDKEERGFLGIFFKSQPEPKPVKRKRRKARKPDYGLHAPTSMIAGWKAEIAELRDMITREQAPVAVEAEVEPEPVEDEDDA